MHEIRLMEETAREAGEILIGRFRARDPGRVAFKEARSIVTEADNEAEDLIVSMIAAEYPDDSLVGEEKTRKIGTSGRAWHIDPLDGTENFSRGIPHWCVSIGLEDGEGLLAGVVLDPVKDERFGAVRDGGAWMRSAVMGEREISPSAAASIEEAVIATGFAALRGPVPDYSAIETFSRVLKKARGIRRCGSAALDLVYTASGRVDGFWEMNLSSWDLAAGVIIAREAGAVVTDISGGEEILAAGSVVTSGRRLHPLLLAEVSR